MRKKLKSSDTEDLAEDYQTLAGDLAEAIVESLKDQPSGDLDPVEGYVLKVRTKVHTNLNIFRTRFLRGYKVLIEEVARDKHQPPESSRDSPKKS